MSWGGGTCESLITRCKSHDANQRVNSLPTKLPTADPIVSVVALSQVRRPWRFCYASDVVGGGAWGSMRFRVLCPQSLSSTPLSVTKLYVLTSLLDYLHYIPYNNKQASPLAGAKPQTPVGGEVPLLRGLRRQVHRSTSKSCDFHLRGRIVTKGKGKGSIILCLGIRLYCIFLERCLLHLRKNVSEQTPTSGLCAMHPYRIWIPYRQEWWQMEGSLGWRW